MRCGYPGILSALLPDRVGCYLSQDRALMPTLSPNQLPPSTSSLLTPTLCSPHAPHDSSRAHILCLYLLSVLSFAREVLCHGVNPFFQGSTGRTAVFTNGGR